MLRSAPRATATTPDGTALPFIAAAVATSGNCSGHYAAIKMHLKNESRERMALGAHE